MTLTFFVLMILIALILGAWWALVDAVVSANWYTRRTTPSDEPSILVDGQRLTERELLAQMSATYQPPSFQQSARKRLSSGTAGRAV